VFNTEPRPKRFQCAAEMGIKAVDTTTIKEGDMLMLLGNKNCTDGSFRGAIIEFLAIEYPAAIVNIHDTGMSFGSTHLSLDEYEFKVPSETYRDAVLAKSRVRLELDALQVAKRQKEQREAYNA